MTVARPHGLVIVNTGDGKGKTTAALGMALRATGHGMRVAFVQFIKARNVGEHRAAERLAPEFEIFQMGCGLVVGEPKPDHIEAAQQALAFTRRCLVERRYGLVVADEILTAAGVKLLTREEVTSLLDDRPAEVHLVLTGRGAWDGLIARADHVTEMHPLKHAFDRGVEAQEGVEF